MIAVSDTRELRLVTERLVIRQWRHEEAARLLDIQSRYDVMVWLADGEPVLMETLDQAHAKIDLYRERCALPPLGYWAIERPDGVIAGSVALMVLPNAEQGEVEIGWHLHPDSCGHGYASEAARAVLAHGFAGGLPEITAVSHTHNERSTSVMRRIGMTDHGITERWYDEPSAYFSMTAEEWASRQANSD